MNNDRRYILLDRDGTIVVEKNYLSTVDGIELLPGAVDGLRKLQDAGFGLIVVTNQSGIARGLLTLGTLAEIHAELQRQLAAGGVRIDAFYSCPHVPEDDCDCRKPKPLLALRAASDFGFDLRRAFVIGDKPADIDLGRNCGAHTILMRTGYGREFEAAGLTADYTADDLVEAARYIDQLIRTEVE
jgi:D-glycero-D-manno-heptose 1,7-bisphosphate phosphatase